MDFGHPPPNMGIPPPNMVMNMNMGPPVNMPGRNNMRHIRPCNYQMRFPPQGPLNMTQDDFDGKRLRKSVMRKTVDYNAAIIKALECRVWQRDWRDRHALQPDAMYTPDLLPPPSYPDNPINAVTTRFVKTATNKMRCPIFAVAWTPEGRRLITGASSGEFTLWNGLTFNFETILQAHDSPVRSMVWSHGEGWMVTGDHSGFIKYWQSNMNNVKMYQAHKEAVRGISFSPSDSKIVTCSDDGSLRIFDFYRCQEERVMRGHGADVKCVQWHPTKALIVSGSKDNQQPIKLWDPKSGTALSTLHAHKSTVMDLKWNDNGNWLITASRDHLLKLFDIRKLGTELQIFRGHKKEASSVVWHPTHEGLFCSGGSDGAILFWNVGTDKEVGCIEGAHESIVWTMAWHPLGHILCSGSNDHTSKFWTRNRPGDLMRDKYNLNTLPPGVQDDHDLEEPAVIPGMGPEDKVEIFSSDTDKVIPGLDLDTTFVPMEFEKKVKKVPYSKPIPRNFQAQWNHAPTSDETANEVLTQALVESVPGAIPLQQLTPSAIFIYGKLIGVEPGSKLEKAISDGPLALKKYIASGELEELHDVMPHLEDDADEENFQPFEYPDPENEDAQNDENNERDDYENYDQDNEYYNNEMDASEQNNQDDEQGFNNGPDANNMGSMNNMPPPMGNMMRPPMPPMGNMGPMGARPNMGPMHPMGPPMHMPPPPHIANMMANMPPPMGAMPPMGNMPPMNNMQPRPPFPDNGFNKPHFDSGYDNQSQFSQNDDEYNEDDSSYEQNYDDENYNNDDGNGDDGYNNNMRNQRWDGGFRGRGQNRGRGRGMNGHGVRNNWRGNAGPRGAPRGRRGTGANRNFRRGGKPVSN
ncbi:pre-mRNA 3' end processing protein WDR33-like isoform X1 [Spodoptera litura]|uniref:Pre-mRNA 3' end processing protein WDR33-like isoform X1 n=1 Tax=Spodoptera litura TaxID=69820 RepID=A0A9J7IPS0_SPOLT|nr:pre-mRNA 3' end processing protein WDR33-like isoform X1 [Spodoptera litura]